MIESPVQKVALFIIFYGLFSILSKSTIYHNKFTTFRNILHKTSLNQYLRNIFLLWVFLSVASLIASAQEEQHATDTIYHFEDRMLHKQQFFYEKWKAKTSKHRWTREIFNVLFDAPTATTPKLIDAKSIASSFIAYEGRIIQNIVFKIVRPFGEYVDGMPTDSTNNELEYFGNRVHMSTKEAHLQRLLSMKSGDILDIKQLEDNEEMLLSLDYIDELYINLNEADNNAVVIEFLVKERFSWSLSYQAYSLNAHKLKLYNKNLWGRGHYARLSYYYNPEKKVIHSLGFEYTVPSIGKSLIRSTAIIEHSNSQDKYSLEFDRKFIDYKTRHAGGLKLSSVKNADRVPTNDIAAFPNSINYYEADAWAGITLPYDLEMNDKYARYRKALTGRIYHINFTRHPTIKADSNVFLLKTTGALLAYNVSKKQLYRSNLMYNYGKVENIPYGHLAQLFVGTVFNEWQRKGYLGANFERAYYNQKQDTYFALRLCGGTFFNKNQFLDGLLSAEARYISKLYRFRSTQHRHFFKLRYIVGFNPTDDFLNLNESKGLRNFKSQFAQGDQKIVLNVEDVFFTPYTLAGFRSAFYSFADLGYISRNNSPSHNASHFYAGIGLGIRLHNNNFIFKTFQISFSLFLKAPEDVNFFRPDASSVRGQEFRDFNIENPSFYFEKENIK